MNDKQSHYMQNEIDLVMDGVKKNQTLSYLVKNADIDDYKVLDELGKIQSDHDNGLITTKYLLEKLEQLRDSIPCSCYRV